MIKKKFKKMGTFKFSNIIENFTKIIKRAYERMYNKGASARSRRSPGEYLKEAPFYLPKNGNNVRSTACVLVVPRVSNATVIDTIVKNSIFLPKCHSLIGPRGTHVKTTTGFPLWVSLHQTKAVSSLSLYSYIHTL
jgi:hypothetical protein